MPPTFQLPGEPSRRAVVWGAAGVGAAFSLALLGGAATSSASRGTNEPLAGGTPGGPGGPGSSSQRGAGRGTASPSDAAVTVLEESGTFTSAYWPGRPVKWRMARPSPALVERPPLVIVLPGRNNNAASAFNHVRLQDHVARTGLAVAAVDGDDLFWHRRAAGSDTGAMVVEEFIPMMRARTGNPTQRIGFFGWSMGAYGGLLLASQLGPDVVGAVVAESAAVWKSPKRALRSAFDDDADFQAHSLYRRRRELSVIPIWLECGFSDPLYSANRALEKIVPKAHSVFEPGEHNFAFWRERAGRQLDWLHTML